MVKLILPIKMYNINHIKCEGKRAKNEANSGKKGFTNKVKFKLEMLPKARPFYRIKY